MTILAKLMGFGVPARVAEEISSGEFVSVTASGVVTGSGGLKTKQAVTSTHDTAPTIAELTTAFGAPATLGRGFVGTVDDSDGDTNFYIVAVSDASFYYLKMTKAAA
jgi:hypothetical protein